MVLPDMCSTCSSLLLDKMAPALPVCPCLLQEPCTIGCVLDLLPVSIDVRRRGRVTTLSLLFYILCLPCVPRSSSFESIARSLLSLSSSLLLLLSFSFPAYIPFPSLSSSYSYVTENIQTYFTAVKYPGCFYFHKKGETILSHFIGRPGSVTPIYCTIYSVTSVSVRKKQHFYAVEIFYICHLHSFFFLTFLVHLPKTVR